ncbi:MAG: aminotransferase class V-fold PLP-dependent enzyme [Planctomycetota bacterium]|jgi:cysteine desulfurase|nr:aminotransferase class V-fold PLP-dependent enzyme [Planctomycetota bacterium]
MEGTPIIYFDNAATTRTDPEVLDAMRPFFCEKFGNASSQYYDTGRQARTALEESRGKLAALLGAGADEVFFTAGATESDNWVIQSLALTDSKKHVITSAIEHHAILEPLAFLKKNGYCDFTLLPVDSLGRVSPDDLRKAIRPDTGLVSIMHANNEIGTIQPIRELSTVAHDAGIPFHTDACQSVGKVELDVVELGVDLLSLSAHKFHGPKGIGALYARKGVRLTAFLHGGGQESRRRAGTSNVAGAVGMAKAAELAGSRYIPDGPRQATVIEDIWKALSAAIPKMHRNGDPVGRIPNLLSLCVEGAEGEAILGYLDMSGIQVSSGSACTSGSLEPSHVLLACGVPVERAHGSIRISLSHESTQEDALKLIDAMPKAVARLREMSVTWKG